MAIEPVYALTVYEDDDTTPLFVVSTDPGHANPYLVVPTSFPEQEVQFAKGAASIGQMNVQIVDVRTDAADQSTGWFTAQLADSGYSALNGHRALFTEDLGSGAETVLNGVIRRVHLLESFVTYELELRDIRERERKTKAFQSTTTPTVFPRGVLDGYGVQILAIYGDGSLVDPIPPTLPFECIYYSETSTQGRIEVLDDQDRYLSRQTMVESMRDVFDHIAPLDGSPEVSYHDQLKVLWRDTAGGGAWNELTQIAHTHPDLDDGGGQPMYELGGDLIYAIRVNNEISGDTLPADTQQIDMIVLYDGPPTEDWPHHIQGMTVGELLRNLYRGDYSAEDPRIAYDESALLALATPVRGRLTEPIEDLRQWAEKHCYPIAHAAPTLNPDGEISPITYLLPDENETLVDLNDTNCRPSGGGWSHGSEDAVNLVRVKYNRDFRLTPTREDKKAPLSDLVRSREVSVEYRVQESIDLLGEQKIEVESMLLTSLGGADGGPIFGDSVDETGALVARRLHFGLTDRFVLGGQYFRTQIDRSDSDVEGLKGGSWVTASMSWMPDYLSGERGLARLGQVVGRRNLNAAWAELVLIDAGSASAPLGAPTLGTVTANAAGVVSIPVTALATGSEARIDYAVSTLEPAAGSELWTFLGRVSSVPTTLTTPSVPQGATVWVRHRGEAPGRRPSAYGTAVSVTVTGTPRVLDVRLELDADGIPVISWVPNAACNGARIQWGVALQNTSPILYPETVNHDADDQRVVLSTTDPVTLGYVVSARIRPFSGWSGSNVTGTKGPTVSVRASGTLVVKEVLPSLSGLAGYWPCDEGSGTTLLDRSGNGRHAAQYTTSPVVLSHVQGVAGTAIAWPGSGRGYELLSHAQAAAIEDRFYVSMWIKVDTVSGEPDATIISRDGSQFWAIRLEQDEAFPQDILFDYQMSGSGVTLDDLITSDAWHFLLAQWDTANTTVEFWCGPQGGKLERVYRNEAWVDGGSIANRAIVIGSEAQSVVVEDEEFTGAMDEIRIGAEFLTHSEIEALFRKPGHGSIGTRDRIPVVQAQLERDDLSETATLTLDILDISESITAVEFSKREGSQDGDVFSAYASTWDTDPGRPPWSGQYVETLSVPGGEESGIRFRVTYVDSDGASRTIGDVMYTSNVDEHTTELMIPAVGGLMHTSTEGYQVSGGLVAAEVGDSALWSSEVKLAVGVEITDFEARLRRTNSADSAVCRLMKVTTPYGISALSTLTCPAGGWSTQADATLAETVAVGSMYLAEFNCATDAGGSLGDGAAAWARVTFIRHTQREAN